MISTRTTALIAALSIVAAAATPAVFAANSSDQNNLSVTEQHAKIKNHIDSKAVNIVGGGGQGGGGNTVVSLPVTISDIDQHATTDQRNTNTQLNLCIINGLCF
jgi:hypothetical protein